MIPSAYITEWQKSANWKSTHQVEQDLVLCRVIIELFSDPFLKEHIAFRGGTALYKLFFSSPPRYSEDIDLVQIKPGGIGEILRKIQASLKFLGQPKWKRKQNNNVLFFKFESETPPIIQLKIKIEINCREHFSQFGWKSELFKIENRWFSGECMVTTYELEELLGTKLRALYQRKKGRDLFDLWYCIDKKELDIKGIICSFQRYVSEGDHHITARQFERNMEIKLNDPLFYQDIAPLLRPDIEYDINNAWRIVHQKIIAQLP